MFADSKDDPDVEPTVPDYLAALRACEVREPGRDMQVASGTLAFNACHRPITPCSGKNVDGCELSRAQALLVANLAPSSKAGSPQ